MLQELENKIANACSVQPLQMQFLVLYVPESLIADIASMLWLVVNKNMFRNVGPLAASALTPSQSDQSHNFLTAHHHTGESVPTKSCMHYHTALSSFITHETIIHFHGTEDNRLLLTLICPITLPVDSLDVLNWEKNVFVAYCNFDKMPYLSPLVSGTGKLTHRQQHLLGSQKGRLRQWSS